MTTYYEFESEYGDLVSDVLNAGHESYAMRIRDWLDLLDNSGWSGRIVADLAKGHDFDEWLAASRASVQSAQGSGRLDWARDRTHRLGQQLGVFRSFVAGDDYAFADFASDFMYAGSQFDDMVAKINRELFEPFSRDLLKHIGRHLASTVSTPPSDRIVVLDHNSPAYQEAMGKLAEVRRILASSNELGAGEPEERSRVMTELAAAEAMLKEKHVRVEAAWPALEGALRWIGARTAETTVGIMITAAAVACAGLLGLTIAGL